MEESCEGPFRFEQYYPNIDSDAIVVLEPEPEQEQVPREIISCAGLQITELYSYYENDQSEQFVELYNSTDSGMDISSCRIRYKNKEYPLQGEMSAKGYMVSRDIVLTKNPSSGIQVEILDDSGVIYSMMHSSGQKKNVSLAFVDGQWLQTYSLTPGAANVYQEFRSCPEGKVINPDTGNCVKDTESTMPKPCEEGYERNPDTGRCRKVRTNTATEYPVEDIEEKTYESPKIFTAVWALVVLAVLAAAYAVFQFRHEIAKLFMRLAHRKR